MEIVDILTELATYNKEYKRDAVDAAIERRDEIIPFLIEILEKVLESPGDYIGAESDYWGHIYALMLLGYFEEKIAHDVIVALFSLPDELPYKIFGDVVTGDLAIILLRTCGGETALIKKLVVSKKADDRCRGAALQALSYAYSAGYLVRNELVEFYGNLFTGEEAFPNSYFHDDLARCVYDIYPRELMGQITRAYDEGLINPFYIRPHEFEEAVEKGEEKALERLKDIVQREQMDSVHEQMSWWACFKQPGDTALSGRSSGAGSAKNRKMKKSKSKQAKASKKANRKKKK